MTIKWKITFVFSDIESENVMFYLYDNHASNIIRKLYELSFSKEPINIHIMREE